MKKILLGLFALMASTAHANCPYKEYYGDVCYDSAYNHQGLYIGGFGGVNFLQEENNVGFTTGLSLGYKFPNNFRIEAETAYRHNMVKIDGFNVTCELFSLMGNFYYDFDLACAWTPYVGLGLGYANSTASVKVDNIKVHTELHHFAYQAIGGISRQLNHNMDLGLEYRLIASTSEIRDHSILLALKHRF